MPKKTLTTEQISRITNLRQTGHSLPEIKRITKHSNASVFKYIQGVKVFPEYADILRSKQGGSRERARKHWSEAKDKAKKLIGNVSDRDRLIFTAGLYWGEGAKNNTFSLINGDPYLVKSFINTLVATGIKKQDIRLNIRIFSNMDKETITTFWLDFLGMDRKSVGWFEIVPASEKRKLIHGMCRVTVTRGAPHFKLMMSVIDFMKSFV